MSVPAVSNQKPGWRLLFSYQLSVTWLRAVFFVECSNGFVARESATDTDFGATTPIYLVDTEPLFSPFNSLGIVNQYEAEFFQVAAKWRLLFAKWCCKMDDCKLFFA
jgi:hypothetical protein